MRIFGLISVKELFLSKNESFNLENATMCAYKMSEDGAKAIVIYGNLENSVKVYEALKDKMDIPVYVYCRSARANKVLKEKNVPVVLPYKNGKGFSVVRKIHDLTSASTKVLVPTMSLRKIFKIEADFVPEITAITVAKLFYSGCRVAAFEDVLSASEALKAVKRAFKQS